MAKQTYDPNPIVISDWRVDGNGVLAEGTYSAGSVLGKDANDDYVLTDDATKAEAVLLEDTVVPTGEKRNAPIVIGGAVAEDALVFGGALTADSTRDYLRDKNIYIKARG